MTRTLLVLFAGAALTAACATKPAGEARAELDQMTQECAAKQGILVPSPGPVTGRDRVDYVCDIKDSGGRLK